jgi:hypothetical protein
MVRGSPAAACELSQVHSRGRVAPREKPASHPRKPARSVTFFSTNEHVFTALAATYVAQLGLHEQTQSRRAGTRPAR